MKTTFVFLGFLLLCVAYAKNVYRPLSDNFDSGEGGRGEEANVLLATTGMLSPPFALSVLDERTGAFGKQLLALSDSSQLLSLPSTLDPAKRILYVCLINQTSSHQQKRNNNIPSETMSLVGIALPTSTSQAKIVSVDPIPHSYIFSVEFDRSSGKVFLLGTALRDAPSKDGSGIFFGSVLPGSSSSLFSTASGYTDLLELPSGLLPIAQGMGGTPSALDFVNGLYVSPFTKQGTSDETYFVGTIDIRSLKINTYKAPYFPISMVFGQKSRTLYTLMVDSSSPGDSNTTFGTINAKTGDVSPVSHWHDSRFRFAVAGMGALDEASGKYVSTMGTGESVQVALVTVDISTGKIANEAPFGQLQPTSLVFVPSF
ncbi:hypothetical protein QOT17_013948 [Balamuthia mandrillaris]